jgi:hypothetical protein
VDRSDEQDRQQGREEISVAVCFNDKKPAAVVITAAGFFMATRCY